MGTHLGEVGDIVRESTGSTIIGALAQALSERLESDVVELTGLQKKQIIDYFLSHSMNLWDNNIGPLLDDIEAAL